MKRIPELALLLLVVLAVTGFIEADEAAAALSTKVDAWVVSGQTITVEDQSFTIYLSSRTNEIMADYGTGGLFIVNNSCDSTGIARICLDNIQYDISARVNKIKVRGISLAPVLTITREVTKNEFLVGEEVTFSVTLKNTGGLARNMTFQEKFPKEFEVTSTERMPSATANTARWTGKLETDESVSFSYKVKALDDFDGSLISSLTYFDGIRLKTAYSTKIELKTSSPLVLATLLGDATIVVGERDNVTINLTNRLPETAVVNAEIIFDPGLKVVSRPYGVKADSLFTYFWSGEMEKTNQTLNSSKALFFEFKGTRRGSSDIRAKVSYRPKSYDISATRTLPESKKSVVVSESGVIVRTSLKDSTIEANQGKRIKVWLQNLNGYARLNHVFANLSTGMVYLPNVYLEKMEPQEQVLLVDKFFYAPSVDKSTGYVIESNVTYLTEFGDNATKTFKDTTTVAPFQEVSLTQSVSSQRVKSGDEITVKVGIKNERYTSLKNIKIFDNVSQEFELMGKNSAVIEARSRETVDAYSYRLKAPHVGKEIVFYVNTTMAYSDIYNYDPYFDPRNHEQTKITPVTVEPEELPLTISRSLDDTSPYVGERIAIKYVITNTAPDKIAKNIVLNLPLMYEFDRIGGDDKVVIDQLGPGESISVANSEKQRAKLFGALEIKKAYLEYENVYGDKYFLNGTAYSVTVKDSYFKGPVILLEKIPPQSANNTDTFKLQLKVKNIGTDPATVTVDDDGNRYSIVVQNGTEYLINKTAKYSTPGQVLLPQATATYSYSGELLRTASKPVSMEIIDNPALSISKAVPDKVSNVESFTVLLKIRSRINKAVQNITVKDGDRSWTIPAIPEEGTANITYEEEIKQIGEQTLSRASVTYTYENALYTVESDSPKIDVEEKRLVSIFKYVMPAVALPGEKVKVTINARNLHNESFELAVSDNGRGFTATLPPSMERNFTYETLANTSTGEAVIATYDFNGKKLVSVSVAANFTLLEESNQTLAARPAGSGKEGFFSKLIKKVLGVLTWKRGG